MPSRSLRHIGQRSVAMALCALALTGPVLAGSAMADGDGSGTDNQRLQPGLYPAAPIEALPLDFPGLREPYDPAFDIDWSVSLRGAYTKTDDDEQFDVLLAPEVHVAHEGSRSRINIDASAELDQPIKDEINVSGLRLRLSHDYALDGVTTLNANADLAITRDRPGTPGLAANIAEAPQTIIGSVDGGVTRRFGLFNVGISGGLKRSLYGETRLDDGTLTDNSEQNVWTLDSGLRLGFQATPIFEVFTQANLGRDIFDRASSLRAIKADATNSSIKVGVAGAWDGVLTAEASAGLGLRRFDAASLGETANQLYDAKLTFTPDQTWSFIAGLATTVAPPGPDAPGTTRVEYAATAETNYTVNSWLLLRAAADWRTARLEGSTDTETGYGYGIGADYSLNRHTAITADYGYEHADSTFDGPQDSHRVTVGVTLSR